MLVTQGLATSTNARWNKMEYNFVYSDSGYSVEESEFTIGDIVYLQFGFRPISTYSVPGGDVTMRIYDLSWTELDVFYTSSTSNLYEEGTHYEIEYAYDTTSLSAGTYIVELKMINEDNTIYSYLQFNVDTSGESMEITGAALASSSITTAQQTTVSCEVADATYVVAKVYGKYFPLTNTSGDRWSGNIKGLNLAVQDHTVALTASSETGGDIDTSLILTVTHSQDEINLMLNYFAEAIEADANFDYFQAVQKSGTFPEDTNRPIAPPVIGLEIVEGDPPKQYMMAYAGTRQRIRLITIRVHLIFSRSHNTTLNGTLYERMKLANWYNKELMSCLENMSFGIFNIDTQDVQGYSHEEAVGKDVLYGCIVDNIVAYQTLEA